METIIKHWANVMTANKMQGLVTHILSHTETGDFVVVVLPDSVLWYTVVPEDYTDYARVYEDGSYQLADGVVL